MKTAGEQENWDDLEVFTAKGARIAEPKVTILQNAQILFNAAFVHRASVSNKTHVILGYSSTNKVITFQFTSNDQAKGALRIVKRGGGAFVGTRSFFNYFFLKPEKVAGRYEPKMKKLPKIGDAWIIKLDSKLPER